MRNLIQNSNFKTKTLNGTYPDYWSPVCPREALRPAFRYTADGISVAGEGNKYSIGCWKQTITVKSGQFYRFRAKMITNAIKDINLHALNLICWLKTPSATSACPFDNISYYTEKDGRIIGEGVYRCPRGVGKAEILLGLRHTDKGTVRWESVSLVETGPEKKRTARVTVVKWRPYLSGTYQANLDTTRDILTTAGSGGSDLVLLPEFCQVYKKGLPFESLAEKIPDGPACKALAQKAREHTMYICAGLLEIDNGLIFNSAVIFNRKGEYIGKYRKTHPFWPEEFFDGESPGDEYPVFDLDFGKVGTVICYDNWYGEIYRLLALKGAELVLFPNEAYEPLLMHARALDNRVHVAVSSLEMDALIVNSKGRIVARTSEGLVTSELTLSNRPLAYPFPGGTMNHASGGRRSVRNSMDDDLYGLIAAEMDTWQNRPEDFDWEDDQKGIPVFNP